MKARGFTLLELMIVAGVAAILFVIAYATFGQYIQRANLAAAVADLGEINLKVQMFDLNNRRIPTSLAEIGVSDLDPWGNPYVFLDFTGIEGNGPKRKYKDAVPVNTYFDVYSMGPDGQTATPFTAAPGADDIVLAGDGQYIGRADQYYD